jgi:glutamate synthase (NADPH) small chain
VLMEDFDAVVLSGGAELPRDLPVPGRELNGIHFAMDFLPAQNKVVAGDKVAQQIMATGKNVVVIGGGDTGSDCVGTSNRHGASSITQFELMPQPPEHENKPLVWPNWPIKLRTSSSHEEGCSRDWSVATKKFVGRNGKVEKLIAVRVEWKDGKMVEIPNSEFEIKADLVLLAMGFLGPVQQGLVEQFSALGVEKDARSNIKAATDAEAERNAYQTANPKVFAAGDMRRGQSLVVWAIREGRQCARAVDEYLMGTSELPR